jgi:hypothetical protein
VIKLDIIPVHAYISCLFELVCGVCAFYKSVLDCQVGIFVLLLKSISNLFTLTTVDARQRNERNARMGT